jgi:acetolactate synthase-1/2/3 large subunit
MTTGARLLVDALIHRGARMAFGVPGESYLAVLDALYDQQDRLRFITCRHEAAAANMAEAYGKLTGQPGLAFVTRGPGATHASIGLHTAFQDSTPMMLFIGQVARQMIDREAFQEIDYRRFLSEVTKWTGEVGEPSRMTEYVGRAWSTALAGRQGPVALALPEDVLSAECGADPHEARVQASRPAHKAVQASPHSDDVRAVAELISQAKRPFILAGGGPWTEQEAKQLRQFAEKAGIPLAVSFRAQSLVDNRSSAYAGHLGIGADPGLVAHVQKADLLLVLGPRLGEMTTDGYRRLKPPYPAQKMVHVHAGAEELGRVYQPDLAINAAPGLFIDALANEGVPRDVAGRWADWGALNVAQERAWRAPVSNPGGVQLAALYAHLRAALPDEAIITNGAGNYAAFLHRFFEYRGFRTQLAPTSGAMGYAVPAGIAAALVHRDRPVISVAGDGCFLMSGNELATAVRYQAKLVFLVLNNGFYGTIRMHQERHYPGRVSGTDLSNPDFVAYARSFGMEGFLVEHSDDFAPALARARATDGPALIEIRVDREAISPTARLGNLGRA